VGVVPVTETGGDGARHQRRLEIDFVARRGSDQVYVQSAYALPTPEKVEQEYRSLRKVRDSFRKFVVVGDDVRARRGDDGIVTIGIVDFLLDERSLEL
jgi:predicted AAA+ superfamily ATPase